MKNEAVVNKVAETILNSLEGGTIPWKKGWYSTSARNVVSGRGYNGINRLILGMSGESFWGTYKNWKSLGANVKKGSKSTSVVLYKHYTYKKDKGTDNETEESGFSIRYYSVFSLSQVEGMDLEKLPKVPKPLDFEPIEACENIVNSYVGMPEIQNSDHAFYSPSMDIIGMPQKTTFFSEHEYYATLFHEMGHSTGSTSRLSRKNFKNPSREQYSYEEMVAEITSSALCDIANISQKTIEKQTTYIKGWLHALQNDTKMVMIAAQHATKAIDWILERGVKTLDKAA